MISTVDILARLLLAAVLGGVIGFDRERNEWAAGLRTHMLVCLGAALAIIVSAFGFADALQYKNVILDPSRVAAQVVSGIGFLGAGTIMFLQREQIIRGLTTAAGLWAVAAIGLAAGSGMYIAAVLTTAVAWVIMAGLKPVERRFFTRYHTLSSVSLTLAEDVELAAVRAEVKRRGLNLDQVVLRKDPAGLDQVELVFESGVGEAEVTQLIDALRDLPGLASISFGTRPIKSRRGF